MLPIGSAASQPALVDLLEAAKPFDEVETVKKGVITKDSKGLESALSELGYEWRYNLRAVRFQARIQGDDAWLDFNDRKNASLREQIADNFRFAAKGKGKAPALFGRDAWADALLALSHRSEVDPFAQYLDALPAWDGTQRTRFMAEQRLCDRGHRGSWRARIGRLGITVSSAGSGGAHVRARLQARRNDRPGRPARLREVHSHPMAAAACRS